MLVSYNRLTLEQKQKITDSFVLGMECRDIHACLGVSQRAVARVLSEAKINTKRRNRYTLNEGYFEIINSQVKAYLLGLMAADGCVTETNYVAFESIDKELTQLLKDELQYSGEVRAIKPSGGYRPHYRINFSSQELARSLRQKGVIAGRGKSGVYYFPQDEYLAAFVLGYFDGDGCAYVNKGRSGGLACIVGSLQLVGELARRLNMGVVTEHQHKQVYYWRIYSQSNIQTFYAFIYQHEKLGLQRKKQKLEQILRSYKRG